MKEIKTTDPAAPPIDDEYFVMQPVMRGGMLLAPLRDAPNEQSWTVGMPFNEAPPLPVVAKIRDGYESAEPRPFVGVPPILSDELHRVLLAAGVGNLDVYEAVLKSADGSVVLGGYKAFNLIGLVEAADLVATRFAPENPSRFLDATIDGLALDTSRMKGLLMFRLGEYSGAVVVHRSVKAAIEAAGIRPISFVKPADFMS